MVKGVFLLISYLLASNLVVTCSCCQECIVVANDFGYMKSEEACVEVNRALKVAHFEVRMAEFGCIWQSSSPVWVNWL
jgi:hypothetical protein